MCAAMVASNEQEEDTILDFEFDLRAVDSDAHEDAYSGPVKKCQSDLMDGHGTTWSQDAAAFDKDAAEAAAADQSWELEAGQPPERTAAEAVCDEITRAASISQHATHECDLAPSGGAAALMPAAHSSLTEEVAGEAAMVSPGAMALSTEAAPARRRQALNTAVSWPAAHVSEPLDEPPITDSALTRCTKDRPALKRGATTGATVQIAFKQKATDQDTAEAAADDQPCELEAGQPLERTAAETVCNETTRAASISQHATHECELAPFGGAAALMPAARSSSKEEVTGEAAIVFPGAMALGTGAAPTRRRHALHTATSWPAAHVSEPLDEAPITDSALTTCTIDRPALKRGATTGATVQIASKQKATDQVHSPGIAFSIRRQAVAPVETVATCITAAAILHKRAKDAKEVVAQRAQHADSSAAVMTKDDSEEIRPTDGSVRWAWGQMSTEPAWATGAAAFEARHHGTASSASAERAEREHREEKESVDTCCQKISPAAHPAQVLDKTVVPAGLPPVLAKLCDVVLRRGVSYNRYAQNFTPLHLAAKLNSEEAVRWLLNVSAAVYLESRELINNARPIDIAQQKGHATLLGLLDPERMKSKPSVYGCVSGQDVASYTDGGQGWAELQHAEPQAKPGQPEMAPIRSCSKENRTAAAALMEEKTKKDDVREQSWQKEGVQSPVDRGRTPSADDLAVPAGLPATLAKVCEAALRGNTMYAQNFTPLHLAAKLNSVPAAKFLLNISGAVHLESREETNQMRPVDIARKKGNQVMISLLDPERAKAKPPNFACACGKDVAACKVCEQGWAQVNFASRVALAPTFGACKSTKPTSAGAPMGRENSIPWRRKRVGFSDETASKYSMKKEPSRNNGREDPTSRRKQRKKTISEDVVQEEDLSLVRADTGDSTDNLDISSYRVDGPGSRGFGKEDSCGYSDDADGTSPSAAICSKAPTTCWADDFTRLRTDRNGSEDSSVARRKDGVFKAFDKVIKALDVVDAFQNNKAPQQTYEDGVPDSGSWPEQEYADEAGWDATEAYRDDGEEAAGEHYDDWNDDWCTEFEEYAEDWIDLPERVDACEEIEAQGNSDWWEAEMQSEEYAAEKAQLSAACGTWSRWADGEAGDDGKAQEEKALQESFNLELRVAMLRFQERRAGAKRVFREDRQ